VYKLTVRDTYSSLITLETITEGEPDKNEQFRNFSLEQSGKMSPKCPGTTAILITSGKVPEIVL